MKDCNYFCVGDIHGWDTALQELLDAVNFDYEKDVLVSLGDLCDRGPRSWEVIEILLKIKELVLIQGNHDIWLKSYLNSKRRYCDYSWHSNGGQTTLKSYYDHDYVNEAAHLKLLKSAVPYHEMDMDLFKEDAHPNARYCFTHGGFNRKHYVKDQDGESMAWDRTLVEESMSCSPEQILKTKDGFDKVFVGHTPTLCWYESVPGYGNRPITTPIIKGGVYNLDTGCGKFGKLTLYNLKTDTYIQTKDSFKY